MDKAGDLNSQQKEHMKVLLANSTLKQIKIAKKLNVSPRAVD